MGTLCEQSFDIDVVKYRVLSPKIIFPVFYEPVRVKIAKIPASIISEC